MPPNVPFFDPFSFGKTSVGFDTILKRFQEFGENLPKIPTYPPYNIKKVDENKYTIEIAVAGFGKNELELELQEGVLTIKGSSQLTEDVENYIFKGIADRAFTRKFNLADAIEVKNAELINGMLKIWLERFTPEEKKAKKININDTGDTVSKKEFLTEKTK